jgi:hypothetical protein
MCLSLTIISVTVLNPVRFYIVILFKVYLILLVISLKFSIFNCSPSPPAFVPRIPKPGSTCRFSAHQKVRNASYIGKC